MRASIFRKARFNAAHRLHNPEWDDKKNEEVFGLCSNPNYHGHNYNLVVKVTGEINPETGYVIDLSDLKEIIAEEVIDNFDHKNLNLDTIEFKDVNPTAENISVVIWQKMRARLDAAYDITVRLYETERNFVEFDGGE